MKVCFPCGLKACCDNSNVSLMSTGNGILHSGISCFYLESPLDVGWLNIFLKTGQGCNVARRPACCAVNIFLNTDFGRSSSFVPPSFARLVYQRIAASWPEIGRKISRIVAHSGSTKPAKRRHLKLLGSKPNPFPFPPCLALAGWETEFLIVSFCEEGHRGRPMPNLTTVQAQKIQDKTSKSALPRINVPPHHWMHTNHHQPPSLLCFFRREMRHGLRIFELQGRKFQGCQGELKVSEFQGWRWNSKTCLKPLP